MNDEQRTYYIIIITFLMFLNVQSCNQNDLLESIRNYNSISLDKLDDIKYSIKE